MPITPEEIGISRTEVTQAFNWFNAMSLNEWMGLYAKHNVSFYLMGSWKTIHEIWVLEGKP